MPKLNVKKLSVAELVALRDEIQAVLSDKIERERADLQKQIDALTKLGGIGRIEGNGRVARSSTRQRAPKSAQPKRAKVAPKYRGPGGETWTGRGSAPRWLTALEAQGKKRESLLIKK